jgi:hypothetical protein
LAEAGHNYIQSAGVTTVNGTLEANNVTINGGTLQGTGTVIPESAATLSINSGGTLLPGTPGSPGTMAVTGNLAINTGGTLTEGINFNGNATVSAFGVTNVSGSTTLGTGSILNIVQSPSATTPLVGTALTILTSGTAVSGTFGGTPIAEGAAQWNVAYNQGGNNVVLVAGVLGGGDVIATSNGSGAWTQSSPSTNWSCAPLTAFACVPNNKVIDSVPINFTAVVSSGNNISLGSTDGPQTIHNLTVNSGGTLTVNSAAPSTTSLTVTNNATNNGTLTMNGGSIVAQNLTNYSGGTLTGGTWNMAGGTIQANNITAATGINTIAAGTNVTLSGGGTTSGFLAADGTTDALKALTSNQGNFTVTNGTTFVTNGALTNTGAVTVGSGSGLTIGAAGNNYTQSASGATTTINGNFFATNYNQSAGTTTINSTGTLAALNDVNITGGTLQGTGTISAAVLTTTVSGAGVIMAGTPGTPGTLSIQDSSLDITTGTLAETITGSSAGQFGVINISGVGAGALDLGVGSVLDILPPSLGAIANGTTLTIVTATGGVSGTFGTLENATFDGGTQHWVAIYNANNVQLEAESVTNAFTATWSGASANWTAGGTTWACTPGPANCTPNNVSGNTYSAILNSAGNTLTLNGSSSPNAITVTSVDIQHGTLDVAGTGSLTTTGNFTNSDTVKVDVGGAIVANNLTNYSGGTLSGGTWTMNGGTIQGNNISASTGITTIGTGTTVTLSGGGTTSGFLASNGTTDALKSLSSNQGTLNITNGTNFTTAGALSNSGTLSVGASTTLNVGTAGASNYTNTKTTTVTGTLNANNVTDSGTTNVESGGKISATGTYTESGTLTIFGNGSLTAGTFDQNGGITVIDANGSLDASAVNINSGTLQVDGSLDPIAPIDVFAGGLLDGSGTVTGAVDNAGNVFLGDDPTPGTLSVDGSYTQTSAGTLDEAVSSSTVYGELAVTGNVTLAGILDIASLGFTPATDELFTLMTFTGTETGSFASIIGADAGDWTILTTTPGELILEYTPPQVSGVPEPRMVGIEIALLLGLAIGYRFTRRKQKAL